MHWVWIVGEWIVGIFDLWVPTIYINPINDLWESIKQEAYWLALWCCSSFPVSLGCSSFNQKRWDSSLSEEHCEISFTSDKVECSYLSFRSNIWEGWHICVSVPFLRTGPNKLLLASNWICHKQFQFPCWLPQPLSRIFLCVSLWYDSLQRGSCKELLVLQKLSFSPWVQVTFHFLIWFIKDKASRCTRVSSRYSLGCSFYFLHLIFCTLQESSVHEDRYGKEPPTYYSWEILYYSQLVDLRQMKPTVGYESAPLH